MSPVSLIFSAGLSSISSVESAKFPPGVGVASSKFSIFSAGSSYTSPSILSAKSIVSATESAKSAPSEFSIFCAGSSYTSSST